MSERRKAFYTFEESEVGNLYYFAPLEHAAGPFKKQRRVEAIIDVDADGCLAGVELIDKMPAPPKAPPMTAPADSRISDERLDELIEDNKDVPGQAEAWSMEVVSMAVELRERRAQEVAPVAHAYVVDGECEQLDWGAEVDLPDDPALVLLYAAPPPAQASDYWKEQYDIAQEQLRAAKALIEAPPNHGDLAAGWEIMTLYKNGGFGVSWVTDLAALPEEIDRLLETDGALIWSIMPVGALRARALKDEGSAT